MALGQQRGVDAALLPELTNDDLKDLGVTRLADRKAILKAARGAHDREQRQDRPAAPEAERHQITVMFCDLVGSTALSEKLDPEDLREVMTAYQKAAGAVVERYEGHVAQYLGDGLMVYFGWPKAHEDDAQRAVRAGLDIVGVVQEIAAPVPLSVRVGISTGPVVVGETGAGDAAVPKAAVGETPNVAARVQGLAEPNTVTIGEATRCLIGGAFDLEDLGARTLKGVAAPIHVFRVTGESDVESRFDASHGAGLTPLVGRDEEVGLLLKRWEQAKDGEGQVVLLSGEAGIGKSRITQALRERIGADPHTRLRYQCSPYHANSAFYPVIGQIERAAGFARGDAPDAKLDKMERLILGGVDSSRPAATPPPQPSPVRGEGELVTEAGTTAAPNTDDKEPPPPSRGRVGVGVPRDKSVETLPLFASLLSLPLDRYPPLNLSPQKQKENTIAALANQVATLADRHPVLMIFEDAHWIDPTTLEVLGAVIERVRDSAVLAVITFRPEFEPPWAGHGHISTLTLNRLSRREGADMVAKVTGGKALPDEVLDQITAKTDGVPLFVEELTKTVLEAGFLKDSGDAYTLDGPLPPLAIPATLQDSLMARLDRLSPIKEIAQLGACIGREFSYELLAAVSSLRDNKLGDALIQLTNSELIFRRGTPPEATYSFKHALVQDAAYQSILKSKRQQLHARLAGVLEERFPKVVATEPELLAHHYTAANLWAQAIPLWLAAGRNAFARSALAEAIGHLTKGLELSGLLPEGFERAQAEVGLQSALGLAFRAAKGYATPEVEKTYARARELCREIGETPQLFPVIFGIFLFHWTRGDQQTAHELAREMLGLAESAKDPVLLPIGHTALGGVLVLLGEFVAATVQYEKALAIYDAKAHAPLAFAYGQDFGVMSLSYLSYVHWTLGYPDKGLKAARDAVTLAREINHPLSLCFALAWGGMTQVLRREPEAVSQWAEEAIAVATEQGFPHWLNLPKMQLGWAHAQTGRDDRCIAQIQEGIEGRFSTGSEACLSWFYALLAEANLAVGRPKEVLRATDEAFSWAERKGEGWVQFFASSARGNALLLINEPDEGQAESVFLGALEFARARQAKSSELRAATSLARLWQSQGKTKEARDLLAPVYGWFTEGFDTADLKDAKALLEALK